MNCKTFLQSVYTKAIEIEECTRTSEDDISKVSIDDSVT